MSDSTLAAAPDEDPDEDPADDDLTDDQPDDPAALAALEDLLRRTARYRHLLPLPSPETVAMMESQTPGGGETGAAAPADTDTTELDPPLQDPDWAPLAADASRDRALGAMLGLAIGDAIGATLEFAPRDDRPAITAPVGGGPFDLAPGEWTDDTTMALCLAQTLAATGDADQQDFMVRMVGWLQRGENTVGGRCFDIGATTRAAVERFAAGSHPAAGTTAANSAGNGSLVRLAPVAIFAAGNPEQATWLALKQSRTTHGAQECLDACRLFVSYLVDALDGADKRGALRPRVMSLVPRLLLINAGEYRAKPRAEIRSTGYVVDTLEAALWSVWTTDSFADAVLTAANLADDADSVAAVAGQLAGALYGASAIPPEWLKTLAWRHMIEELAVTLWTANRR